MKPLFRQGAYASAKSAARATIFAGAVMCWMECRIFVCRGLHGSRGLHDPRHPCNPRLIFSRVTDEWCTLLPNLKEYIMAPVSKLPVKTALFLLLASLPLMAAT